MNYRCLLWLLCTLGSWQLSLALRNDDASMSLEAAHSTHKAKGIQVSSTIHAKAPDDVPGAETAEDEAPVSKWAKVKEFMIPSKTEAAGVAHADASAGESEHAAGASAGDSSSTTTTPTTATSNSSTTRFSLFADYHQLVHSAAPKNSSNASTNASNAPTNVTESASLALKRAVQAVANRSGSNDTADADDAADDLEIAHANLAATAARHKTNPTTGEEEHRTITDAVAETQNGYLYLGIAVSMVLISAIVRLRSKAKAKAEQQPAESYVQKRSSTDVSSFASEVSGEGVDVDEEVSEDEADGEEIQGNITKYLQTQHIAGIWPCIKFSKDNLDEKYIEDSYPKNIRRGTRLLIGAAIALVFEHGYSIRMESECTNGAHHQDLHKHMMFGNVISIFLPGVVVLATMYCNRNPDKTLYWALVVFFGGFCLACNVPPIAPSCKDVIEMADNICPLDARMTTAKKKMDCGLHGHTSVQIFMLFVILMPYVLPNLDDMYFAFLWIGLYFSATVILGEEAHYKMHEYLFHTVLMFVTLCFAVTKKYFLEKSQRKQFADDLEQRKASEKLYYIFEDMVPKHVIPRMIRNDLIADPVERVSVLFIVIADFEKFTSKMDAKQLLNFLNDNFSKMDAICVEHRVTKIETVGEEYVACVGVLPEDVKENSEKGHGPLLERLINCADEILGLQDSEVQFKMGMHSGPIVAGVIGSKLPRFRLFGDTINTSARMMQKGQPGTLQFGKETRDDVPEHIPIKTRGEVEMKGKGKVMAYVLDRDAKNQKRGSSDSQPRQSKRASITTMELLNETENGDVESSTNDKTGAAPKQKLTSAEFDKVMAEVTGADQTSRFPVLGERAGFTPEMETEWQHWYHNTTTCRKFVQRVDRQALALAFLTLLELLHMNWIDVGEYRFKSHGWLPNDTNGRGHDGKARYALFLVCRATCWVMIIAWRFGARTEWMRTSPVQVQSALTCSSIIAVTLTFLSYDAVVVGSITNQEFGELEVWQVFNQQFSLVFALAFFIITNVHPLHFFHSTTCVPVAGLLIYFRDKTRLYFSATGRLVFLSTALLTAFLAHEGEQSSRARFKSKRKVHETQERIHKILHTLMPPLVVEELRLKPIGNGAPPSHEYNFATIAQSDLCGFTQLAATRTPEEVVSFVSDLFGRFDVLTDEYQVYKVETIGDAYIAGMAEKPLTERNSPVAVVLFGLAMINATAAWAKNLGVNVRCRVGVHHGDCYGGIVGVGMMRYHLFGHFMSAVDTLEATSEEAVAQISTACKEAIEADLKKYGKTVQEIFGNITPRDGKPLKTSKGEVHEYSEVGGPTFLIYPKDVPSARSSSWIDIMDSALVKKSQNA